MTPLRVGVVGLGVISGYYLAAIDASPGWELAAVCDLRDDALARFRGRVPCYRQHEAMLAAEALDAVIVTAPNDVHAEICAAALAAGVPVCVEKPLALSPAQGRRLLRRAAETATTLFTAFHRRYNDNVAALRRAVRAPDIASIEVRYRERIEDHMGGDTWYLSPERCGGGCVADNGPNAFDLVRLFLGDVGISDVAVRRDGAGVDRYARIQLRSGTGATATVELDWSYPGEIKDVTVQLTDGSVHGADMLAGHPGFKSSLRHEYVGVLGAFSAALESGASDEAGMAAVELVTGSYARERAPEIRPGES